MRARVLSHFQRALETCDVIMTPATPTTAPMLAPEAHTTGAGARMPRWNWSLQFTNPPNSRLLLARTGDSNSTPRLRAVQLSARLLAPASYV